MDENIQRVVARLEAIVEQARVNKSLRPKMAQALNEAFTVAGKTKSDFQKDSRAPDKATIDRWFAGKNVPQPHQVKILRTFLGGVALPSDHRSLASCLLDPRFRPVICFLFDEEKAGRIISEDQLHNLLWLTVKSKGTVTRLMISTFLGCEQ